eukprot:m.192465 g.192465  ORF g.192465 m.192465 type:complete len:142 (-) comp14855_c0_seq5:1203-1628(-)
MFALGRRAVVTCLRTQRRLPTPLVQALPSRSYHENVIDHYENPRNVGALDVDKKSVGTGLVGAPACGDVMKLQVCLAAYCYAASLASALLLTLPLCLSHISRVPLPLSVACYSSNLYTLLLFGLRTFTYTRQTNSVFICPD